MYYTGDDVAPTLYRDADTSLTPWPTATADTYSGQSKQGKAAGNERPRLPAGDLGLW